ncbi:MAG TPA: TlyA family RNA methyltransferase [Candidatus Acidoferrum sp.]|nr:TlyA family RNA methyltransferase [Candidatus Acidoferrum sp.]
MAALSEKKPPKPGKERLDVLLVERGLAPSRERARALLLAGQVRVNGMPSDKPGTQIAKDAAIEIVGETLRYASRAGLKLEGALEDFGVSPAGEICLDIGSSTGGFTDCLLQRGATRVHAVDVTIDQLDWKLRNDARVHAVELNARHLRAEDIGEPVDLVTIDVSFISVAKILPAVVTAAGAAAEFVILVKPQFELEKGAVGKGGIVRDELSRQRAVGQVKSAAANAGLEILGSRPSRVKGAEGNQEFFLHARRRT